MSVARASEAALIQAPAPVVYAVIADYRDGHPRILPARHFPRLEVEEGGVGAGTIIRFQVRLFGRIRVVRAAVTEPDPGRVLVETDLATDARTTFTVTPDGGGTACRVEIGTEWDAKGLRGWIERVAAPRMLRRIYLEELAMLRDLVSTEGAAQARGPA